MILHGIPVLFGVEARAVFDAYAVASAIETADLSSTATHLDLIAVADGLGEASPAAAEKFQEKLMQVLRGRNGDGTKKIGEELAGIIGNTSRRQWVQTARFATHPDTPMLLCERFIGKMQGLVEQTIADVFQLRQNDIEGLQRIHDQYVFLLKQLAKKYRKAIHIIL